MSALSRLFRRKPTVQTYNGWMIEHAPPVRPIIFPYSIPQDGSFRYVNRETTPLAGKKAIRMRFRWDGTAYARNTDNAPARVHLYFQRKGDTWQWEPFRWWSRGLELTAGEHELSAELVPDRWTTVNGTHNGDAFKLALAETARVGMTFGGGDHNGHGIYAFPSAIFNLLEYVIE